MKRILITGATGNIGQEVIHFLHGSPTSGQLIAGVRDIDQAKVVLGDYENLAFVRFDFEEPNGFKEALSGIDTLFLLRPPHISDVSGVFQPLLQAAREAKIRQVIFLSVQGVERSRIIPHHKIERLIRDMGFAYIFVRPSYFMQNLTTTLLPDIRDKRKIILPAGKAKFNWVDTKNIGAAIAVLLNDFEQYQGQALEITGEENKDFETVAALLSSVTEQSIRYQSIGPLRYYRLKRKEGYPRGLILVMILLHYLPRFQDTPQITVHYRELTGKSPTSLKEFIHREKEVFI